MPMLSSFKMPSFLKCAQKRSSSSDSHHLHSLPNGHNTAVSRTNSYAASARRDLSLESPTSSTSTNSFANYSPQSQRKTTKSSTSSETSSDRRSSAFRQVTFSESKSVAVVLDGEFVMIGGRIWETKLPS
eukprot:CAMPEP_0178431256 /NCGR_PEP_ID=MMETSP0689_2-20121128/31751_1 /TAXON_ID=160604 /ORGANISM="Amphidinium massartii, Strain CS-259" /LENGTH=129 /DNA_ID=CAMNT_0020053157 /DNA_START=23 /DNA_END=412 /DNA_ORIENTATION=+